MADMATFIPIRQQPTGPVETFSTERADETVPREIRTEDVATVLMRYENGARGVVAVSQVSAGPQEPPPVRDRRLRVGAAAWDSETAGPAVAGPSRPAQRDPAEEPGADEPAGRAAAALPGGHVEGFADTFAALFRAVYADVVAGGPAEHPPYATFADGHEEMLVGDAIAPELAQRPLGRGRPAGRTAPMLERDGEARLPDCAASRHAADGGRRLGGRQRVRQPRDRRAGRGGRPDAGATPGRRTSTSPTCPQAEAGDIVGQIEAKGLKISGLGFYPNPLHPDPAHATPAIAPPQAGHRRRAG